MGFFAAGDGRSRGPGHAGWLKNERKSKYMRGEASKKVSETGACILRDHAKNEGTTMQLRPRGTHAEPEATYTPDKESNSYRLFHAGKICDLFNLSYHQHQLTSPNCPTRLEFDYTREQQMGVCWIETLKCTYCHFRSQKSKLYEEVDTGKRGTKPAKPNLALWTALLDNPIMGTGLQEIFQALNCPAPSASGLQHNANKVGPMIVQMVQEDLKRERTHLKDIVEGCGYPRNTPIPVEGDGRYNNPLYWSRDRNPFQPATQSSYTITENVTEDKKIIGCTPGIVISRSA